MNAISALLILLAILISVLTIGVLIMWWKGVTSIFLPGLGIVVATALVVLLLLIIEVVVVVLAILTKAGG
jgi:hypothetical protein